MSEAKIDEFPCLFPASRVIGVSETGSLETASSSRESTNLRSLGVPCRRPDDPLEDPHRDIARSVQAMYEEAFFHQIGTLCNNALR